MYIHEYMAQHHFYLAAWGSNLCLYASIDKRVYTKGGNTSNPPTRDDVIGPTQHVL
jgi:hypothetical protein